MSPRPSANAADGSAISDASTRLLRLTNNYDTPRGINGLNVLEKQMSWTAFCESTQWLQYTLHMLRTKISAICTLFVAAPLRTLSATTHKLSPLSEVRSSRILPT